MRTPSQRALRAQGGALTGFCRESRLETHAGLPGIWRWRVAYLADDRFGISMVTDVGEQSYLTDGTTVRGYTDGALLVSEPLAGSALQTLVRWTAATTLSVLADTSSNVEVDERASTIEVRFVDDDARYVLRLGGRDRLLEAAGPIDAPPIGAGRLHAEFADFREVDGRMLPFRIVYRLNGRPLLDEHVLEFVPRAPWRAGERPTRVPACASTAAEGREAAPAASAD